MERPTRKVRRSVPTLPQVMTHRLRKVDGTKVLIGKSSEEEIPLIKVDSIKTQKYKESPFKDNPYLNDENIEREELMNIENMWAGHEERKGWSDIKLKVLQRDNWTCQKCWRRAKQVHHINGNPRNNRMTNLESLCEPCHKALS